jgi:mono/diheme cytochrome c family protein
MFNLKFHKRLRFLLIPLVAFLLLLSNEKLQGGEVRKPERPLLGNDIPIIRDETSDKEGMEYKKRKKIPVILPGPEGKFLIGSRKGDPDKGKEVYEKCCIFCHGKKGFGDGVMVIGLKVSPPSFIEDDSILQKTDQEIFDIITYGVVGNYQLDMPAWGPAITVDNRLNVIAYIKKRAKNLKKARRATGDN